MKNPIYTIIAGLLLICTGWYISFPHLGDPPLDKAAHILSLAIENKKEGATQEITDIKNRFDQLGVERAARKYSDYYSRLFDDKGLFIAVFEQNELAYWSDNRVAFEYLFGPGIPDEQYLKLESGWYGLLKHIEGNREYYALFQIRSSYPHHNAYLYDDFQRDIPLPNNFDIYLKPSPTSASVMVNGDVVFHLERTGRSITLRLWLNFILIASGLIALLTGIEQWFRQKQRPLVMIVLLPLVVAGLRYLSLYSENPFADIFLFNPALYASSFWFPSLGDLLVNSVLITFLGYFLYNRAKAAEVRSVHPVFISLLFFSGFSFALFISPLIFGLIENSRINLNLNDVFNLSIYSALAVASIGMLLFSFNLFSRAILRWIDWKSTSRTVAISAIIAALIAHITLAHLYGIVDFKIILWPVAALPLIGAATLSSTPAYRLRFNLILLAFFSIIGTFALIKYTQSKERNERMVYAERLASDEDPVTELLFDSVADLIANDLSIRSKLKQSSRYTNAVFADEIEEQFTDRYWNKYDFTIHIYKPDGGYWGILPELRPPDLESFNRLIEEHGYPSSANAQLYHLYNYPENLSYLAKVPVFENDTSQLAWVVIGLESKLFPDEIGFPELLIDQDEEQPLHFKQYSYARYIDDKLVATRGNYNYRLNTRLYEDNEQRFEFENYKDYSHLVHRADDRTIIVVSKENLNFFDHITTFIYLFVFFGTLFFILLPVHRPQLLNPAYLNHLNVKIQLLSAGIIIIALVSFGVATRFYTVRQFKEKNERILSEKIQSVLIELESQLINETAITDPLIDQLKSRVLKLSYVFFTDINIYNEKGELVASSQPKIFEAGLVAPRMNSEAYVKMVINQKSDYIQEEKIGALKHLSAYVPFRNFNNDIVAYVNLPYFARQDALEDEIARLFVTMVNIFVLLLAMSIVAAVFISNRITRPLQELQRSLSRIELGRQNEQIVYKGSDVIGNLVHEYNRKVSELEIKAEELARSERESAWREMARQVAHEIKNPLTPMKLNIQLLQKAVDEGQHVEHRIARTAEVLIEQIDTLSEIANAFSNFAKMPRAELAEVNLNKLIENVVELYRELPGVDISYHPQQSLPPIVHADYNQLLRAIQNLIKNSLQATDAHETARIQLSTEASESGFIIKVSDNGEGIPEDMQDKIFRPNFTTKTTGMGLGLAMVQSIVQNINGKIWFETETGCGTTFFIEIPARGDSTSGSK